MADYAGTIASIDAALSGTDGRGTLLFVNYSGLVPSMPEIITGTDARGTLLFVNYAGKRLFTSVGTPSTTGAKPGVIVSLVEYDMPEGVKQISATCSVSLTAEIFSGTYVEGTKSISGDGASALSYQAVAWQEGTKQIGGDGASALSYEGWTYSEGIKSIAADAAVALHREFLRYGGFPPRRNSDYDPTLMYDEDAGEWLSATSSAGGRYKVSLVIIGYDDDGLGVIYIG